MDDLISIISESLNQENSSPTIKLFVKTNGNERKFVVVA